MRRYQILKPVIIVENERGFNQYNKPMPGRKPGSESEEKNQIRKLQLRTKIGTAPDRGGA